MESKEYYDKINMQLRCMKLAKILDRFDTGIIYSLFGAIFETNEIDLPNNNSTYCIFLYLEKLYEKNYDTFEHIENSFKEENAIAKELQLIREQLAIIDEHITYMPNGTGYQQAKEEFQNLAGMQKK